MNAGRSLLAGAGLHAILDTYLHPADPEAPSIGVPDLTDTLQALEQHARAALEAADRVQSLAAAVEFGDPVDERAIARAALDAAEAEDAAQGCVRAIGTALLGATSQQGDADLVHLHEHAASCAIADGTLEVRLGQDDWPFEADTRAALLTEVAGICCRLLLEEADDEHTLVSWELPNGSFLTLEGDTRGICVLAQDSAHAVAYDAGAEAVLVHVGWPEGSFHGPTLTATTEWYADEGGLVVSEIAHLVVGTLIDVLGATDVAALTRSASLALADTL